MKREHIYLMANDRMPGIVKVGRTNDLNRRLAQHNGGSSVVGEWRYKKTWRVSPGEDVRELEAECHHRLGEPVSKSRREQFEVAVDVAVRACDLVLDTEVKRAYEAQLAHAREVARERMRKADAERKEAERIADLQARTDRITREWKREQAAKAEATRLAALAAAARAKLEASMSYRAGRWLRQNVRGLAMLAAALVSAVYVIV